MSKGIPILPNHPKNPVGQVGRIRKARGVRTKQLRAVKKWLRDYILAIPFEIIVTNAKVYEFQISVSELERVTGEINSQMILNGNDQLIVDQALAAYEDGTAQSVVNLANISEDYTRSVTQVLASQPYQRRVALASSRIFEGMQGFNLDTSRDLGRVLSQAISDGRSPLQIVGEISERFKVAKYRAERIARTEITQSLRRARWDEARGAEELGIKLSLMWLSALSPTTRKSHADKHGNLYSVEYARVFYSEDANAINCKCSQVEVLVDKDGKPATPDIVNRQKQKRRESLT
jgi:SPP1 gp7 family putative phage head morphogenesis protein